MWIDIDSPDKSLPPDERLAKSKELLDNFVGELKTYNLEPSHVICSGHGYHVYFILRRIHMYPPTDDWLAIQTSLVAMAKGDIQASGSSHLMRFPGTFNYKNREKPRPVYIHSSSGNVYEEKAFSEMVKKYYVKKPKLPANPASSGKLGFVPPCISRVLDPNTAVPKGYRHLSRLVLATFGFHEGWALDEMIQKVVHFTDDPKKSGENIRGVYEVLQDDPTRYSVGCGEGSQLQTLIAANVTICDKDGCKFGKTPKAADKEDMKTFFSAHFDGLIDLVLDDGNKVKYLVKQNGNLVMENQRKVSDGLMVPPPAEKILWLLPKYPNVINHYTGDSDQQLYNDLVIFFRSVSELPDDDHYKFLACYVLHTYLHDKSEYSPMIWFHAIPERGKTRTGKALTYTAYRGVHLATLREAHVIRLATHSRATIFLDLSDLWQEAEAQNVKDILLNRYEAGAKVPRVLHPDLGPFDDTVYFDVYGPTVAATNEVVNDILATRAIQIIMPQSSRVFHNNIKQIDGLALRERLVAFRARWFDKQLPDVPKPCLGSRLGDILHPIRQIVRIVSGDEGWFLNFVCGVEQRKKLAGADSLDAQVVNAIKESLKTIKHGHMLNEDILAKFNLNRSDLEKVTPQKLGRITSKLGFEKYSSGQQRGIVFK